MDFGDRLERHFNIVDKGEHPLQKFRISPFVGGADPHIAITSLRSPV